MSTTARIDTGRVSTGAIAIRDRQQQRSPTRLRSDGSGNTDSAEARSSDLPATRNLQLQPEPSDMESSIPAETLFAVMLLANSAHAEINGFGPARTAEWSPPESDLRLADKTI